MGTDQFSMPSEKLDILERTALPKKRYQPLGLRFAIAVILNVLNDATLYLQ